MRVRVRVRRGKAGGAGPSPRLFETEWGVWRYPVYKIELGVSGCVYVCMCVCVYVCMGMGMGMGKIGRAHV